MPTLLREVVASDALRRKLFQANFLTTTTGDAVVSLLYHRQLDETWEREADALRRRLGIDIIGRARKQKKVLAKDFVVERVAVDGKEYSYKQLEGSFTQPNAGVAAKMLAWARSAAVSDSVDGDARARDSIGIFRALLRNGHFTIALAPLFRKCLATEISKVSVAAAHVNMAANGVDNVVTARLSAEELCDALGGGRVHATQRRRSRLVRFEHHLGRPTARRHGRRGERVLFEIRSHRVRLVQSRDVGEGLQNSSPDARHQTLRRLRSIPVHPTRRIRRTLRQKVNQTIPRIVRVPTPQ